MEQETTGMTEAELRERLRALSPEHKELLYRRLTGPVPESVIAAAGHAENGAASSRRMAGRPGETERYPLLPGAGGATTAAKIPLVRRDTPLPLSPAQRTLWYTDQMHPGAAQFNMPMTLRLRGPLKLKLLQESLNRVIARHEILRSTYSFTGDRPLQRVRPGLRVMIQVANISQEEPSKRELTALHLFTEDSLRPFDLENGPLLRANLIVMDREECLLLLNVHHICCDGGSLGILGQELWNNYDALCRGEEPRLPELPVQYLDFAAWQEFQPPENMRRKQLDFWRENLKGLQPATIPFDRPRPLVAMTRNGILQLIFPRDLVDRLRELSRQAEASLFMVLLGAFQTLLYRYSGRKDIAVTSIIEGRDAPEVRDLIGFFSNPLILRTRLEGQPTFLELLRRTRRTTVDAFNNHELSYVTLLDEMRQEEWEGLPGIFFQLLQNPMPARKAGDLDVHPIFYEEGIARQDAEFHFHEDADQLKCLVLYNKDIYDEDTFLRLARHYRAVLEQIVVDPEQSIDRLHLFSPGEARQILQDWNATGSPLPQATLWELFRDQARRNPVAPALTGTGCGWSYGQLEATASNLAAELENRGVGLETRVGLYMDRSPEYVIAVLAILCRGATYVPLDPEYPRERLDYMAREARLDLVLVRADRPDHPEFFGLPFLGVRAPDPRRVAGPAPEDLHVMPAVPQVDPEQLAYIMYTSGSTGDPHPVGITHRGVIRLVHGGTDSSLEGFGPGDVFLQLAPLAFDASTFEIWGALLNGARLVLPAPGLTSFEEIEELIEREGVTALWLSAGLFHQMVETRVDSLRKVPRLLTGGETVSVWHARRYLQEPNGHRLINGYGPTENTTFTSTYTMTHLRQVGNFVSIGKPISNTEIYILDDNLEPVPIGVPGELYTAGEGLARGYLGRPALTAERFLPNPFAGRPGARMYRTGDLARWLPDGQLQFLGRVDDQIKLNGYRVEPAEIETRLRQHPAVSEAAVVPVYETGKQAGVETGERVQGLVAFLVPRRGGPASADPRLSEELREYLRTRLPQYMIPGQFVFIEDMPLSPAGKLNRWALIAREVTRYQPRRENVAPRTPTERRIATIWSELLEIQDPGVHDDFFSLGGSSLLAIRLKSEIRKRLRKDLPLHVFLQNPTIEHIARALRSGFSTVESGPLIALNPTGTRPPLFCVHPAGGNSICYMGLARELGRDQPFYAFQAPALSDTIPRYWSVEDLAEFYVATLRGVQPTGPYYLGGWSFGGQVAFEMARRLEAEGEEVALLALFDSAPPDGESAFGPLRILGALGGLLMALFQVRISSYDDLWSFAQIAGVNLPGPGDVLHLEVMEILEYARELSMDLPRVAAVAASNFIAGLLHKPRPVDFRKTVLFRAGVETADARDPFVAGWNRLAPGGLQVQPVPGDHMNLLEGKHVGALAERMRMWLTRARYTG